MLKLHGRHEGDRSETYATTALSAVGHVVPVARQSDFFLTDFIVHLFEPDKQIVRATGLEFGLQNKSNDDDIEISGEQARLNFFNTMRPFFIGVFNRRSREMAIYTTIHRLCLAWTSLERDVVLKVGGDRFHVPDPAGPGDMYLGEPIAVLSLDAIDQEDAEKSHATRKKYAAVIARWVQVETMAIVWRRDFLPWVPLPLRYKTNEVFDFGDLEYAPVLDRTILSNSMMSVHKSMIAFDAYLDANAVIAKTLTEQEKAAQEELLEMFADVQKKLSGQDG